MAVKVRLGYPDSMRREIRRSGMELWARGGRYDSFADAVEDARREARERNFPVQVTYMGQKMTVYPDSLGY